MQHRLSVSLAMLMALSAQAQAFEIKVTITNLAPDQGVYLTPVWVGLHDGGFDTFNTGSSASAALERLAEDGDTAPISADFSAAGYTTQGTIQSGGAIPPFAPGSSQSMTFMVDPSKDRYFSFLTMIIPSNDAFIGNGNPTARPIFDDKGGFLGADFTVLGSMVYDAGTEVNDEIAANTAFLGQAAPNTGVAENGLVQLHPGFIPGGTILSDPRFVNADFTAKDYAIARIQVSAVPLPAALPLLLGGLGVLGVGARRRGV